MDMIDLTIENYVATVTLARPPVNAIDDGMKERLIAVFDKISDLADVRSVVLTAAGKVFCAGADLRQRPSLDDAGAFQKANRLTRECLNAIRECRKPVVAAVNGVALGLGFGLVASCDIIVAAPEAVFGMPEIDVGLAGGAAVVNRMFGRSKGRLLMFTGRRFPAVELHRLGLIEIAASLDQLSSDARKIANEIAGKSPTAMRYAKRSANVVENMPERDAYRLEQEFTTELSLSEDAIEARRAVLEKRSPVFRGT